MSVNWILHSYKNLYCMTNYVGSMSTELPEQTPEDSDNKELRLEHPSGWLYLTMNESVPIIVDALLGLPPREQFNKTELAEHSGVSRQSVTEHVDRLVALDILEAVPDTSPTRYRVTQSNVVQELYELNSALNAAGMDE